jgi:hypothetical protein
MCKLWGSSACGVCRLPLVDPRFFRGCCLSTYWVSVGGGLCLDRPTFSLRLVSLRFEYMVIDSLRTW